MSNALLHIKDSYYFEIPKALLPRNYRSKAEFPNVWVKNDDQFQAWEAEQLYHGLEHAGLDAKTLPDEHTLIHEWQHWQHAGDHHENFGKPLDAYLEHHEAILRKQYDAKVNGLPVNKRQKYSDFLASPEVESQTSHHVWFAKWVATPEGAKQWADLKQATGGRQAVEKFKGDESQPWSAAKIANYNAHLSGKIVLDPQPFGELRNMYEAESGFCISKFMILEVVIGILLFTVFTWLAGKASATKAPKGRLWNLLEVFLLFIRDQIARPAIGGHHADHEEHADAHAHGHEGHGKDSHAAPAHTAHDHHHGDDHGHAKAHAHAHVNEGDRFVPLLWTIFFFVLTCNLFGAIPWLGAPTGSFATTLALAAVTFSFVVVSGMFKFGFVGFFMNQIPSMELPLPMAILLKPMIFAIEILGLFIKHLVLSIRLLANMVAGHLVILGIMALAFGAEAAMNFSAPGVAGWQWWLTAGIAVAGATLFNILELFVAFLQAYIFTFLSALFIGAAVHKH